MSDDLSKITIHNTLRHTEFEIKNKKANLSEMLPEPLNLWSLNQNFLSQGT